MVPYSEIAVWKHGMLCIYFNMYEFNERTFQVLQQCSMSWCSSDCALSQQISATKWLTTNILQPVCFRQDRKCQPWQGSRLLPGSGWSHTSVCDWTVRENVFLLVGHGEKERMLKTLPARDFWVALLSRPSARITWDGSDNSPTTPTVVSLLPLLLCSVHQAQTKEKSAQFPAHKTVCTFSGQPDS